MQALGLLNLSSKIYIVTINSKKEIMTLFFHFASTQQIDLANLNITFTFLIHR